MPSFNYDVRIRQRLAWSLMLLLMAVMHYMPAEAQNRAYYSTGSGGSIVPTSPQLTAGGSVSLNPSGAAVAAVLTTDLNNPVTLRLPLANGPAPAGYRAGMLLANATGTGVGAIGTTTLRTYLNGVLQESRVVDAALLQANLLSSGTGPTPVDFVSTLPFDAVEVQIANLANVNFKTNVYNAYGVKGASQVPLKGQLSRFSDPTGHYSSTAYSGTPLVQACVNSSVSNPANAAGTDLTAYATFGSVATLSCPPTLRVQLEGGQPAPAGYYAGFTIGNSGLLDADVLGGLRIRTFLNGVPQETAVAGSLLELNVLPGGQTRVGFPTTLPFDAVSIERTSTASVLDNLRLYYGFGLEPRAFGQSKQVLSDFSNPAGQYSNSLATLVCALCGITNPQNAANSSPTSYAQFATALGVGTTQYLSLNLNGNGLAGNRAGMIIGPSDGLLSGSLLSADVLKNLTLSTYDKSGKLLETAAAGNLLAIGLLPDGRSEISFLTTQPFATVRLDVASGVSLLSGLKVYNAFADDPQAVLPLPAPLPVELVAFRGRRTATSVALYWATASERNSNYFIVERSTDGTNEFLAVGQVAAAGSSSSQLSYQFIDAKAASLAAPVLYYRLRQVDVDGTTAYSPVVALVGPAAALSLQVYPNPAPAAAAIMLQCTAPAAIGGTVQVYSELGQLVQQLGLPARAEVGAAVSLALPALPAGFYNVVVRDGNGQRVGSQRLVVASL